MKVEISAAKHRKVNPTKASAQTCTRSPATKVAARLLIGNADLPSSSAPTIGCHLTASLQLASTVEAGAGK